MKFEVKSKILGFENINEVELSQIDELFSTLRLSDGISFTLVDPSRLREYAFEISNEMQRCLEIKDESDLKVYNVVVIQNPPEESKINFQAPLIFNTSTMTMAQDVLSLQRYPEFGFDESVKSFINS
ncbi:MAG: flagellar assembly protein FliW [Campylobacterales bacterium]|nr:flagellar assembly protein FliW [Campylobacterales bacterium]